MSFLFKKNKKTLKSYYVIVSYAQTLATNQFTWKKKICRKLLNVSTSFMVLLRISLTTNFFFNFYKVVGRYLRVKTFKLQIYKTTL